MSTPSLLNIPYLYKAGTLYSQIPESGAGDFTVTRATTPTAGRSTRINKDGLIELVADNVPRLDYPLGGAVNGCPALLVEPSATNLSLNSNSFSVETAPVATVVQNQVDIFENPNSAWLMSGADSSTDAANANNVRKITSGFTSGSTYAGSIYIKSPTGAPVTFRYRQATITTSTVASGDGWFRAVNVSTLSSTSYRAIFYTDSGAPIIICHSQAELGSVPTSYIGPVGGTAIARAADVISRTSASALIGQSEGTIYAEFSVDFNNRNADILSLNTGNSDNGFFMSVRDTSVVQLIVRTAGANALIFQRTGAFPIGVNKLAMAYKNGDFAICLNGTAVQTNTSNITMPSVSINKVSLGENALYVLNQQLRIRAAALYPNRLTNAQLAALTAP